VKKHELKQKVDEARQRFEEAALHYMLTQIGHKTSLNELIQLRRAKEATEREYIQLLHRYRMRK
jgi:hypothetical protein